jgi:hypothetical protein
MTLQQGNINGGSAEKWNGSAVFRPRFWLPDDPAPEGCPALSDEVSRMPTADLNRWELRNRPDPCQLQAHAPV